MDESQRMKMLTEIIHGIQDGRRPGDNLNYLDVRFRTKRGRIVTDELSVQKAMDCMISDVYLFADFDLREAYSAEVISR